MEPYQLFKAAKEYCETYNIDLQDAAYYSFIAGALWQKEHGEPPTKTPPPEPKSDNTQMVGYHAAIPQQ